MIKLNTLKAAMLIAVAALCVSNVIAQPNPPSGKKWQKVENLSDEFDTWDGTKWTKPLWNYGEPVQMVSGNSGVSGGNLWIKATHDSGSSRWFQTSRVMSKERITFPMYTECSMITAHISAFSTYWLNNGDIDDRDEIDICEHNSKPSWPGDADRAYEMYSQYFIVKNGVTERAHMPRVDTRNLPNSNPAKGKKWNETYQTLGCYWKDEHNVSFYINGQEVGSVQSTKVFTRSLNIIWDLWTADEAWTGGIANPNDLSNNNINTMYVDWIHTYKLIDNPSGGSTKYFLVNRETGKKVRTSGNAENTPLELVPSTWNGASTQWEKINTDNGYFYFKNVSNGMYFRPIDDTENSVLVQKPTSYSGSWTQWKIVSSSGGYFYLENRATGDYFRPETSANYSDIIQKPSSWNGNWTQWALIPVSNFRLTALSEVESTEANVDFSLAPNPAEGYVKVLVQGLVDNAEVSLSDFQGREVYKRSISEGQLSIDTRNLKAGIYLVKVYTAGKSTIKKLIVR
ncbi:T9SS type A sorting domain-containing protein [Reichenbachiella versicolor]|uniref:T9SS type A sorting domain-containing protein n=1 Tax=Reichenbachiella versicolor TaxID=1821036 RepID=UPI000D6E82E6|nr:T9SS type A sorting domain-containing protein [Reichenbachiella versicolor]